MEMELQQIPGQALHAQEAGRSPVLGSPFNRSKRVPLSNLNMARAGKRGPHSHNQCVYSEII